MSALLVEDLAMPLPTAAGAAQTARPRTQPARWRHVGRRPEARPHLVGLPGGRPRGVPAPEVRRTATGVPVPRPAAAPASWQLTDRGIAVVVVFFLALVATAAVVLVTGFLTVSDAPPAGAPAPVAAVAAA